MKIITNSTVETQEIAQTFAKEIENGGIVLLFGELGSGKTTFTQGLAKALGITRRIISPTFIIVRKYDVHEKNFYHIDLYRTQTEDDLKGIGLPEILQQTNAIVVIEWPEKLGSYLPTKRWEIHFATIDENIREIRIEKYE